MTIQYGGIGLTPPDDSLSIVTQWWHGHRIEEFDHPGFETWGINHLPIPQPPKREPPRIGVLHWPAGASRWATCHLIATGDQVTALTTGSNSGTYRPLILSDGTNSITTSMFMLPPRPISQKGDYELYLITLVDERWFWWQTGNGGGPERGDVATPSMTWGELIQYLFTQAGASPTIDAIPSDYDLPTPIRWDVGVKPVPVLIDAACECVGMRVVRQLDGTITVQSAASALTSDQGEMVAYADEVYSGGDISATSILAAAPSSIAVVFWGFQPLTIIKPGAGESDGVATIIADLPAQTKPAKRSAYATQAALDYNAWVENATLDYTLRGFWPHLISGNQAFLEWVHDPEMCVTRAVRQVWSDANTYGDKPPEVRFAAEITSAYDEDTGYSWSKLYLNAEDAEYDTASPDQEGSHLFDVNDNQELQAGDRVLMWSNPDGCGWMCQVDIVHKTICEDGELKDQVSTDGGVTWRDPVPVGAACVSQSGSGSGSGGGTPDPCTACIPPADSPPVAGAGVPIQVSTICLEGILYVTEAKARIVFDETNRVPKLELYDYNVYAEGCCECQSGSGSGGCPGPALTLTIDCTVE